MMLLDVFLEGLFEMDLRRVNSEEIGHAMNLVLEEANERIKFPLRKMFINTVSPGVSQPMSTAPLTPSNCSQGLGSFCLAVLASLILLWSESKKLQKRQQQVHTSSPAVWCRTRVASLHVDLGRQHCSLLP
jgi:hypothetical protein